MILLVDNYDSFTYNLVQYFCELGAVVKVRRNDAVTLEQARRMKPSHLVVSPGPGRPESAGRSMELIKGFAGKIPVLGVCLGHQSMAQVYGGKIVKAPRLMHGKSSPVHHDGNGVYRGLANPFVATRYHSLVVERRGLPGCFRVVSETPDGVIMGIRHKKLPMEGVQFHPESVLTLEGKKLLENFLEISS